MSEAREAAVGIVRRLVDAGHVAYFAGGCVRDRLLGMDPKDFDIATDATPERIKTIYPRAQGVGESFGILLIRSQGYTVEVATFRTDGLYEDGRHPNAVTFGDARGDANRRDFTINGLFEDPIRDEIIDYVGGRDDLDDRVVRAIGDADARLREDRLRILRAVRFAARFEFRIDADTATAIRASAMDLKGVSRERIGQEIRLMLENVNRAMAAGLVESLGVDTVTLGHPRTAGHSGHLVRLASLPAETMYPTALAAWLLDRLEADGPLAPDAEPAAATAWAKALMLSRADERELRARLDQRRRLFGWDDASVAARKRLAASDGFGDALALHAVEQPAEAAQISEDVAELARSGLAPTPLLTGDDLIRAGLDPGPAYTRVLEAVYDAQLEGRVRSTPDALDLARSLWPS